MVGRVEATKPDTPWFTPESVVKPKLFGYVFYLKEHFGERAGNLDHNWLLQTSQPCYTGTSYLQALPDINALVPREAITTSPRVNYAINFTTPGTHTIWIRGYPARARREYQSTWGWQTIRSK